MKSILNLTVLAMVMVLLNGCNGTPVRITDGQWQVLTEQIIPPTGYFGNYHGTKGDNEPITLTISADPENKNTCLAEGTWQQQQSQTPETMIPMRAVLAQIDNQDFWFVIPALDKLKNYADWNIWLVPNPAFFILRATPDQSGAIELELIAFTKDHAGQRQPLSSSLKFESTDKFVMLSTIKETLKLLQEKNYQALPFATIKRNPEK